MKEQEIRDIVAKMMGLGLGRRSIARELSELLGTRVTEWAARRWMADVVNRETAYKGKDLSKTKSKKGKPSKKIDKTYKTRVRPKRDTSTVVEISGVDNRQDTPATLVTRDVKTKVAVLSDIHYPYENPKCLEIVKAYLQDYKPDIIVLNGDITDCYSVSRYEKNMKNRPDLQDELDYTRDKLWEWVEEHPDTEFYFIEGNHEERLRKHVAKNAAALLALRELSFPALVELEQMGITWIGSKHDLRIGNLYFTHGNRARKHAGTTARAHFEDYGASILVGHVHRLSVAWKRNKNGHHAMIENGTLCDFNVEYLHFPDWQHGFTTVEFDGEDFSVQQHAITDFKLIADGKVYAL